MEVNNQIPVLTQNNWNTWKQDMQVILMHYGCWQFIIQTKPEELDEGATYKEKWLPQEFQSTVQQIYRWKEEDFTAVKIEAELILEANRLQLMKQDLEKTETVYFSNFLSTKKLSKIPSLVVRLQLLQIQVVKPNIRKRTVRKGIDFKPKTNGYPRLDLNFPDYDDEEDDFDTVRDSLASRLVSKTSTETPSTSFEKPDLSSDNRSLIPCSEVKWIRNIGREVTGSNVYYGIAGTATRLRSFNEIERYCNKNNIQYDPSLFDFRKEDTESQEVNMVEVDIPNCYKQAIRSREASKWHDAMDREINIMRERKLIVIRKLQPNIRDNNKCLNKQMLIFINRSKICCNIIKADVKSRKEKALNHEN
ncbi:retrovirus-related Pol polyprotein from transposon RE1 [Trichonephila clavata]|uniref:Retrovirus-related Pol polyprotein from transposon RE1 n=1 Tax=Trichonephila clavata TaxID=2740835 RepID=A0A8X6LGY1_TRICU|nr:retrovirus-related Pol polyprotein from transposon RE1 [Trichonephila clavata]